MLERLRMRNGRERNAVANQRGGGQDTPPTFVKRSEFETDPLPTIPQLHYYHDDIDVSARFCYSLGGSLKSTSGGSLAR